jgi:hypothetical protein
MLLLLRPILADGPTVSMTHQFRSAGDAAGSSVRGEHRGKTLFGRGHGHDLAPFEAYHHERGLRRPVVNGSETRWRYRVIRKRV